MASPEMWQTWQKWEGHVYTSSPTPVLSALGTSLQVLSVLQLSMTSRQVWSMQSALVEGRIMA